MGYDFGVVCNVYGTFRASYVEVDDFLLFLDTLNPELPRYPTSKAWISELRQYFLIIFEVLKNSARDLWESHFLSRSDQYPQRCTSPESVPPSLQVSQSTSSYHTIRKFAPSSYVFFSSMLFLRERNQ